MRKIPFSIPPIPAGFKLVDLMIMFVVTAALSMTVYVASGWRFEMQPAVDISLDPKSIPLYAVNSLVRMFLAYALSLGFSIWYGYTANRSKAHEKVMIPLLDILQSIPVLSFLPGVVMAMIALFPNRRIGVELASILLIFTGQVWNMAFSYYNSINTIPRELAEVTRVFGHNRFRKFMSLDLPFSAIGLIWNSMMSMSGGWFFLMACEMFVMKDRDFRLPGLGSYIKTAADAGDMTHVFYGIATMVLVIIVLDMFVWRPVVAWSQKFKFDTVQAEDEAESTVLDWLRKSVIAGRAASGAVAALERAGAYFGRSAQRQRGAFAQRASKSLGWILKALVVVLMLWWLVSALKLFSTLHAADYLSVLKAALYTTMRTTAAIVLASLWTVPLGVYIGFNPRAARVLQPMVQVVASIPATAVFPVVLVFLVKLGQGLALGSIFLMLLGTQWYILFNVIAGALAIPQDLKEAAGVYGIRGFAKWRALILPGIFPYLVTGLITATGGAWNASIVSEYVTFSGDVLTTTGLGCVISEATVSGNFALLLLATVMMASVVVGINRLVWKRMFLIAQEKYRLE
jgi:NitT/TauT family transport system permease protein